MLRMLALIMFLTGIQIVSYAKEKKLNVLLIMADDVGFECFSSYGSKEYSTPNLDALAESGIRFTQTHSTPLCTPSRVNLMSGKSNVFNYEDFGVYPNNEPTFGNHFLKQGYRTAVAGKWQLQATMPGKGISPSQAGFETSCLWNIPGGARERYWQPSFVRDGDLMDLPDDAFGPDVMTDFLIDFIQDDSDSPFLAYYPMILVHDPFVPTPQSEGGLRKDKTNRSPNRKKQNYIDMVHYMDHCVGRLIKAVEETGQRDQTLIIFTSDNGTNAALSSKLHGKTVRGGKGYTHDYGTHVPLIVNLPGRVPPNRTCKDLIAFSDFFPTIVEAAGLPPKSIQDGDGWSFWPQCVGQKGTPRDWIYGYYFPRPYSEKLDNKYSHYQVRYARDHRYKLYDNGDLHDTITDVMETSPLPSSSQSDDSPQGAARVKLQRALDSYPAAGLNIRHQMVKGTRKPGSGKRSNYERD
ncbi:sulfatase-like hydrolase/transferase [bacterium]|nr:sulfatase-like hydrolase/transferase [bacterium]MDC0278646.1 sulfatase-like hydrolase/transferase [bacterium]